METSLKKSLKIGTCCITAYLVSYISRNVLSVCTPHMLENAFFDKEYIGLLSSVFFCFYAVGQLFSGIAGDAVKPRNMIFAGFFISSACMTAIPLFLNRAVHFFCFSLSGLALSMLRGPITKLISENTEPKHAKLLCTVLNAASFAGPLVASALSVFLPWRSVFAVVGIIGFVISTAAPLFLLKMERAGKITCILSEARGISQVVSILKLDNFVFYMLLSAIGEIVNSSITFWIPTYITEHLGLSSDEASVIFTLISLSGLIGPFLTLFIYEKVIKNDVRLSCIMYALSGLFFLAVRICPFPYINITLFMLAKLSACCAVAIIWSVYIPSLAKSGMVSGANGVMDSAGYLFAAISNAVFSGAVGVIGWNGLVDIWCALMIAVALGIVLRSTVKAKKQIKV